MVFRCLWEERLSHDPSPCSAVVSAIPQFGNSECGQCAHGDRGERDIWIRAPRVLLQLRNRQVCNVACGGLHTVAVRPHDTFSPAATHYVHQLMRVLGLGQADAVLRPLQVTSSGAVYTWGCDDDKALGRPGPEGSPVIVDDLRSVAILHSLMGCPP